MSAIVQVQVNVESGIFEILSTCAGAVFDDRIFPKTRGSCDVYPSVVYNRVSTNPYTTHDSAGGLNWARFQIDIYGKSYTELLSASNAVLGCLRGFNGVSANVKMSVTLINMTDYYEGVSGIYRMRQDYRIHYNESSF